MIDFERSSTVSVYATFADEAEARRIARAVVEERLAACANILGPCHSVYRWQDKVEEAGEAVAIFKSTHSLSEALVRRIADLHSYELPAIAVWDCAGSESFDDWVIDSTR
ncbi:MAG TPA: divalent-cation tolerance protein CutA [Allosphingosinicella sp.]|nr:divalent-cation tolerance protein CutA [Allosphingosinicella sp.]